MVTVQLKQQALCTGYFNVHTQNASVNLLLASELTHFEMMTGYLLKSTELLYHRHMLLINPANRLKIANFNVQAIFMVFALPFTSHKLRDHPSFIISIYEYLECLQLLSGEVQVEY